MQTADLPRPPRRPPKAPPERPRLRRTVQFILTFLTCVLIVNAAAGEKGFIELLRVRRAQSELAGQIAALRQENVRLRAEARRLREDPEAIEEIARRELGLIRPGEILFIIRDRER